MLPPFCNTCYITGVLYHIFLYLSIEKQKNSARGRVFLIEQILISLECPYYRDYFCSKKYRVIKIPNNDRS